MFEAEGIHAETTLLLITLIKWQRHPRGAQDSRTQTLTDAISGNQWPLSMGIFIFGNDQLSNFCCEKGSVYILFSSVRGVLSIAKSLKDRTRIQRTLESFICFHFRQIYLCTSRFFFSIKTLLYQFLFLRCEMLHRLFWFNTH